MSLWMYDGTRRPKFATPPAAGQESVWDYPRPPRIEPDGRRVIVRWGDVVLADTLRAVRVLETASPPTFYLPPDEVDRLLLAPASGSSYCEWKGEAAYWSVEHPLTGEVLDRAAWSYPVPLPAFAPLAGWLSFYPACFDCSVGGAPVQPQPGGFYGGWVTPEIVGPYKGEPGTAGW